MKPIVNFFRSTSCLLATALLVVGSASAANFSYTGVANTTPGDPWSSAGTVWDAAPTSANDTILNFGGSFAAAATNFTTNDISGNFLVNRINFNEVGSGAAATTAPSITLSGNTLEFVSNGATTPVLNINATGTNVKPLLSISNNLVLTNNLTITGGSDATLSGNISGTGTITSTGSGTVTLTGTNSFTDFSISSGTLSFGTVASFVSPSSAISVGVNASSTASLGLANNVTLGAGKTLTINGLGTNSLGALTSTAGNNTWAGNVVVGSAGTRIGVSHASAGSLTVSGVISGVAPTIRSNVATEVVTLSGANTYTGPTRVVVGILAVSNIGNVGASSGNLGASTNATNGGIILGNGASNSAIVVPSFRYTGTGETTDRTITLEAGSTVGVNGTIEQAGTGLLKFSTALNATSSATATKTLTLSGSTAGTGEFAGVLANGTGSGALGISKTGSGAWTLSGVNTYTGSTSVSNGTLVVANNAALGGTTGGTTAGSTGMVQLLGGITVTGEALEITPRGAGTGPGSLGVGLQGLAGNSEWTGAITTTSAAVATGSNARISADTGANLTLSGTITGVTNSPNTFILGDNVSGGTGVVFTGAGNVNATGVVSGAMSVITTSSGVVTLSNAANSYTGQTRNQGGTIAVTKLSDIGVASSLGAPAAANSDIAFFGTNTALRYIGSGDSTNRSISVFAGTSGAIVEQAGSGALTISGNFVNPGAASSDQRKTLTLTGSTSASATYSGNLVNATAGTAGQLALSLAKTGTGTWTVSGPANTYTGGTSVSGGGKLIVAGGGINSTAALSISGSSTLELGASNVLNDAAALTLNSSTLITNGNSETTGALTLIGNNQIDLGTAAGAILSLAKSSTPSWTGATLTIQNWTGLSAGGGTDQVIFGTDATGITTAQLAKISFLNPSIDGVAQTGTFGAAILGNGEIVALIPEPSAILITALGSLAAFRRRRN